MAYQITLPCQLNPLPELYQFGAKKVPSGNTGQGDQEEEKEEEEEEEEEGEVRRRRAEEEMVGEEEEAGERRKRRRKRRRRVKVALARVEGWRGCGGWEDVLAGHHRHQDRRSVRRESSRPTNPQHIHSR